MTLGGQWCLPAYLDDVLRGLQCGQRVCATTTLRLQRREQRKHVSAVVAQFLAQREPRAARVLGAAHRIEQLLEV